MQDQKTYITQDKIHAPFLLACSFNGHINFIRSFTQDTIVYWEFSPHETAQNLIESFEVKVDPLVPSKDIFAALEVFWRKVYSAKKN